MLDDTRLEQLRGTVETVIYSNEESGFTVLELDAGGEQVTAVGTMPGVVAGEEVVLTGRYASHPTYGQQFKAEICERALPASASAILKYLSSGAIKGVGPRTAVRIVELFGDEALEVIEKTPERLTEIKGISAKKAREISEEYRYIFGIRAVMLQLTRYGIEPAAAIRVWKQWGNLSLEVIQENPFRLCGDPIELPFEKADEIALELNMDPASPHRLLAGICHVLYHNLGNGHTCLPQDKLLRTAATLLEVEAEDLEDICVRAVEEGGLVSDTLDGSRYVYLPDLYESETYVAGRILLMLQIAPPETAARDYEKEISALEESQGIEYAALQRRAIRMALQNNIFILTGGPGTGKTTALRGILSILEANKERVALAAPTGRAAKRMSEVTGQEAKTIHRLLEVDYRDDSDSKIKFKRNEQNPLRVDAVILDEVSMVDIRLLHSLMKGIKLGCRLILVGDPDQLPSVGPGNVLRDLIASDAIPTVHLSEIFRQAQESRIVSNAHLIVRGEDPELDARDSDFFFLRSPSYEATAATVADLCASRLPKAYGFSPLWDIQVVVPSRVGALGTTELNRLLQQRLNPPDPSRVEQKFGGSVFREGDKVMQIRNNYDIVWRKDDGEEGTGVFNGDIGIIEMLDRPSQSVLIRYDERVAEYTFDMIHELEHAYAITVHKSQGSEFEAVVTPLMNYHPKLYYRNILYTGVTRARKILILLGKPETVHRMVANHRKVLRYTNLARLVEDGVLSAGENPLG